LLLDVVSCDQESCDDL